MIDAMVFKENFPYSDWSCCRVWWNKFCRKQKYGVSVTGYSNPIRTLRMVRVARLELTAS